MMVFVVSCVAVRRSHMYIMLKWSNDFSWHAGVITAHCEWPWSCRPSVLQDVGTESATFSTALYHRGCRALLRCHCEPSCKLKHILNWWSFHAGQPSCFVEKFGWLLKRVFALVYFMLFMVALCNRADHYIFMLFLSFFPRLISAVGDWMFTILWHMVWP